MRRLQKYLALTPAARALVRRSLLLLPLVATLLRARGMARAKSSLERLGRHTVRDSTALTPREIARLVDATASFLGTRCLPRSLVLCHLLRRGGQAGEMCLGVSKMANGSLSAHAWVELDGLVLNDGPGVSERYAAFTSTAAKIRVHPPQGL